MRLKDSLTDVINKSDNAYLAFGAYTVGRLGDSVTTILGIEKYGLSEGMLIGEFFIERFGTRGGTILHELTSLAFVLGIYKILSKMEYKTQNVIPYGLAIFSIGNTLYNLQLCLDKF